jgi:hypothetical protein
MDLTRRIVIAIDRIVREDSHRVQLIHLLLIIDTTVTNHASAGQVSLLNLSEA